MKIVLLTFILFGLLFSQEGTWYSFYDEKTEYYGYKDVNGTIKVKAQYNNVPYLFENMIFVHEVTPKLRELLLLKDGTKLYDKNIYSFDQESEGTIRYRDKDKIGFLGKRGQVLIPAEYSMVKPMVNHYFMALKDAEYVNNHDHSGCNHRYLVGGRSYLMNDKNEIVVEDFKLARHLDWYSAKMSESKDVNSDRDVFQMKEGGYISFINFKKQFTHWYSNTFTANIMTDASEKYIAESIKTDTHKMNEIYFMNHKLKELQHFMSTIIGKKIQVSRNSSGSYERNPTYEVRINCYDDKVEEDFQAVLTFKRAKNGYRLTFMRLSKRIL